MSSPPWEPQQPPPGPPPGWQPPHGYRPDGGHGYPPQPGPQWPGPPQSSGPQAPGPQWPGPQGPGPQWPAGAYPPPYNPQHAGPHGAYGVPPPGDRKPSRTPWIIAIVIASAVAVVLLAVGLFAATGGGPRDERSYQEGRAAAQSISVLVKFGGATPEEACESEFVLRTPMNKKSDVRRGDFIAGCVDALAEKSDR